MKQSKFVIFFLIFLLFHCLAAEAFSFSLEEKVFKTKLKNGITVLIMERHISPTVSLYIRHRIGAVDEDEGETGAAHMLEHMMFKGTKTIGTKNYAAEKKILAAIEKTGKALDIEKQKGEKANAKIIKILSIELTKLQKQYKKYVIPSEIDRLYTQNGGSDMNASTGQDITTYMVSLPANRIELWARIESDRLLNPVFREFYSERDVVMEERRQRTDTNPDGKLYEAFMSRVYLSHPYRNPIIGWPQDIIRYSPSTMKKYFEKYRAPHKTVITVVGAVNTKDTLKLINKYFGLIPASVNNGKEIPAEPKQTEERRVEVAFDANPMMIIGFHKPNFPAYDDYVFDVLETILSDGRTSRLYNLLVTEKQIADSVRVYNGTPASRYPNLFTIFAKPRHPHTNAELEKEIIKQLEIIKFEPVTDEELARAKNKMRMDFIERLDSNTSLAATLSYFEVLLGDYRYFSDYIKNIEKVTAQDIQQAAKTYLDKENRTIAVLERKKD